MDEPNPATPMSEPESEPEPVSGGCSEAWAKCGGKNWEGSTCCEEGFECTENNDWYWQVRGAGRTLVMIVSMMPDVFFFSGCDFLKEGYL